MGKVVDLNKGISDSEFAMWRAIFAFAFADHEVSAEERAVLDEYRTTIIFSQEQLLILSGDFAYPQDVEIVYRKITLPEHRHKFCAIARALAWCDGDLDRQEERILKQVACLKSPEYADDLKTSREHPELHDYYEQYEKNGMMGFFQPKPLLEVRV